MATTFQLYVDPENISNPAQKGVAKGQRRSSTKTFHEPTPRKALGDLGNIKHGTEKKFQTPKPVNKMRVFDETPKTNQKKTVKPEKGTFSVPKSQKWNSKIPDVRPRLVNEDSLPEIENMIPFIEQEYDLPTPQCLKRLLEHPQILNPSVLVPPRQITEDKDDNKLLLSKYDLDTATASCLDDNMECTIQYDGKIEFCEVDENFGLHFLPPLEDISLDMSLLP